MAEFIEDCATIRKAMLKINELSADMNPVNFNQVRIFHTEITTTEIVTTEINDPSPPDRDTSNMTLVSHTELNYSFFPRALSLSLLLWLSADFPHLSNIRIQQPWCSQPW